MCVLPKVLDTWFLQDFTNIHGGIGPDCRGACIPSMYNVYTLSWPRKLFRVSSAKKWNRNITHPLSMFQLLGLHCALRNRVSQGWKHILKTGSHTQRLGLLPILLSKLLLCLLAPHLLVFHCYFSRVHSI